MIKYLLLYALTVPIFLVIDMLWLGIIARKFYQQQLAHFLGPVNWSAAIIFYLIFIVGIIIFSVVPALHDHSDITKAIILGFLFGFIAYATYDLTNLATLKNWPLTITIVDMFWGGILSATVASASFGIAKWIGL